METTGVSSTSSNSVYSQTGFSNKLGQDAFLKLLITELRYQDPMNAMEDKEFISQLAQFSSLEQLQKMGDGFSALGQGEVAYQAISLIGKKVEYIDPETEGTKSGVVSSVVFENGSPRLTVGKEQIVPAQIVKVEVAPAA